MIYIPWTNFCTDSTSLGDNFNMVVKTGIRRIFSSFPGNVKNWKKMFLFYFLTSARKNGEDFKVGKVGFRLEGKLFASLLLPLS